MKKPEKELGYYMGWFVAYLLAAGFTVYFLWLGKPVSWCSGAQGEHCFREWVSSLGGWAGAAVTLATVIYLAQQINEERENNRRNLRLALQSEIETIEKMQERLNDIRESGEFIEIFHSQKTTDEEAVAAFPPLFIQARKINAAISDEFANSFVNRYVMKNQLDCFAIQKSCIAKFERIDEIKDKVSKFNAARWCKEICYHYGRVEEFIEIIEPILNEQRKRLNALVNS